MWPNKSRACVKSAGANFGNDPNFDMTHFDETSRWMGWPKNEFSHRLSPEPTAVGAGSSAVAVHVASRRWLSFVRHHYTFMKRSHGYGICAAVVAVLLGFWVVQHIRNYTRNRQIAMTLLEMHHQWATNGYHLKGVTVPAMLANDSMHLCSVGKLGAFVEYDEQKSGIVWSRRLSILRADTNSSTWTLYEIAAPTDSNLSQMAWKHKLITVTGEP